MPPLNPHTKLPIPIVHDYALPAARGEILAVFDKVRALAHQPIAPLQATAWLTREPVAFDQRTSGREVELHEGDRWGGLFDCAWIRVRVEVPASMDRASLVLMIDLNGEALVVDGQGRAVQGLTNGSSVFDRSLGEPGKRLVRGMDRFIDGSRLEVWLDAGCNDLFGTLQEGGVVKQLRLGVARADLIALGYDMEVLLDLASELGESGAHYHRVLHALWRAILGLRTYSPEEVAAARAALAPELARRAGDHPVRAIAAGHAHIDLAWLWPLRETWRKAARTFATVDLLMERNVDYRFCASQPQLYAWVRDQHPELYARVKRRVAQGRWEPIGAMWVEADNNLASGEALVRQFLYGKRFFREEFGVDTRALFIPDDFGYSTCLPQIMRGAGVESLLTIKMSWDAHQAFPHNSFIWRGQDGSEVLVHMPPEGDYNSAALPRSLRKAEGNFAERALLDEFVMLYGIGDGGGGPGEEHLERLARVRDLHGVPPTRQDSIQGFFDRLAQRRADLPVWSGEMFLHRHQGTFTTQSRSKQFNRRGERLLREAEMACVEAWVRRGVEYPHATLDRLWKEFLLYQFHDILPGSSITRVYDESLARYASICAELESLIARGLGSDTAAPRVWNTLPFARHEWMQMDGHWVRVEAPALAVVDVAPAATAKIPAPGCDDNTLDNGVLRVEFAPDGAIARLIDRRRQRDVLHAPSNVFHVYHDAGDAWDFPRHTALRELERPRLVERRARLDGPRAIVSQRWTWGRSTIEQDIVLMADSPLVEFRTVLDWRDDATMLRVSFAPDVAASEALSGVQYGHVRRPLHTNTPADRGKFEQYAHRWIALAEPGGGVALLNDSHYGHSVAPRHLELNLVRTPSYPDPTADRCRHAFAYALMPFAGTPADAQVEDAAHAFNAPLRLLAGASATPGLFEIEGDTGVMIDAIKKAEDADAVIVRLHESAGRPATLRLRPRFACRHVVMTNLMEEPAGTVSPLADGWIPIGLRAFELATVRFDRG